MKRFVLGLFALLTATQLQATDIYVKCFLTVREHVGTEDYVVSIDVKDVLFDHAQTERVDLFLKVPGYKGSFGLNPGFSPVVTLEDESLNVRTRNLGWKAVLEQEQVDKKRVAALVCQADA